jgi:hypothetical protein
MKSIILLLAILFSFSVSAQKLNSYDASNGLTYKVGDTVKLGLGSGNNGNFVFLRMGGWAAMASGEVSPIGSGYSNMGVVVKKIRKSKMKGVEKVIFTVGGGNITNYVLSIEDAIETCEVKPCKDNNKPQVVVATSKEDDKYDKLAKLKELFDDGILTKEEYEAEKKKLLDL